MGSGAAAGRADDGRRSPSCPLLQRADAGDAEAQFELARLHAENGDTETMRRRIEQAALGGHARAQFHLGEWHFHGRYGLAQDREQALRWYGYAAAQNHTPARQKLAQICEAEAAARTLDGSRGGDAIGELF